VYYVRVWDAGPEATAPPSRARGLFAQYLLDLDLQSTAPPRITSCTLPGDNASSDGIWYHFSLTFGEDMLAPTVNAAGTYDLRAAGLDGQFNTADDEVYSVQPQGYGAGLTANYYLPDGPLQPGDYRFIVKASLKNTFGTALAPEFARRFAISGVAGYLLESRANASAPPELEPTGDILRTAGGRGRVIDGSDLDYWRFPGTAGQRFMLGVEVPGRPGGSSLYYRVEKPDGGSLTEFGAAYDGAGQLGPVILPETGTYSVRVSFNYGYTGEFRFRVLLAEPPAVLEQEDNDHVSRATSVELGAEGDARVATVMGYVRGAGDLDYCRLGVLTNGSTVFLSARIPVGSRVVPVVGVYDEASGYVVETATGRPFDGVAEVPITQTATYYALLRTSSGTGGLEDTYALDIRVVPTGTVTFPNLQVVSVTAPEGGGLRSGQPASFAFTVRNVGGVATPGADWVDRVVMSRNTILGDVDDIQLGLYPHSGALAPGAEYEVTKTVNLPDGISGDFYLLVQTDFSNTVSEFVFEADNVTASAAPFHVSRSPYPDLVVEGLSVAGPGANNAYTITWTTANRGDGAAVGGFKERLLVRNLTSGQTLVSEERVVGQVLEVGATLPQTATVTAGEPGNYQVLVTTDVGDQVYEFDALGHEHAELNTAEGAFRITRFYTVAVVSEPLEAGQLTGGGSYAEGATATVTATPITDKLPYRFQGWTESRVLQSQERSYSFTVTRDRQLVASFVLPSFQIAASNSPPEAGLVTGTGVYVYNAVAVLTAKPSFGYRFVQWTEGGQAVGAQPVLSHVVTTNRLFVANYAEAHLFHEVATATSPEGLATVSGAGRYTNGQTATITAPSNVTRDPLVYSFKRFTLNGAPFGASRSFSKTFATTDPTNMLFVAEYEARSLRPLVVAATGSVADPVPATINYVLTLQFDRTMKSAPAPLLSLTNDRPGAVQAVVPEGGVWLTTTISNDTFRAAPITFSAGMDGTHGVWVSQAQDGDGNAIALTNVLAIFVDATPPVISEVAAAPRPTFATVTWKTDEPATASVQYGLTASYGSTTPPTGQLATAQRVVVANLTPDTVYHFRVRSRDRAGNEQVSSDATFRTTAAPDLQVLELTVLPANLQSSAQVTVSWRDANSGVGATAGSWSDLLVVSNLTKGTKLFEKSVPHNAAVEGDLAPGQSLAREVGFALPDGPAGVGEMLIAVTIDAANEEFEHNAANTAEKNNTATVSRAATLAPYPDLAVTRITAPAGAPSGQQAQVVWAITNQGPGAVTKRWSDGIYLALNASGTDPQRVGSFVYSNGLAAGAALVRTQSVILPVGVYGDRFLVVVADEDKEVYEVNEGDNSQVAATALRLQGADLVVQELTVAANGTFGGDLSVSWQVKNAGDAPATARWIDRVLLWSDRPGFGDAFVLLERPANDSMFLGPSETYTANAAIRLPLDARLSAGAYQVKVVTDAARQQPESNENNNEKASPTIPLAWPELPDLAVTQVTAPDTAVAGETILLSWTTVNQGGAVALAPWHETIYISTDQTRGGDRPVGSVVVTNPLAPGEFLVQTQAFVVPDFGLLGELYFIVETDSDAQVFEVSDANNALAATNSTRFPATLTLRLTAARIAENAANPLIQATVTRNSDRAQPVTVTITNSDPSELTAPAEVVIPAGQASATFDLTVVADGIVDGLQQVKIDVVAPEHWGDAATVEVVDSDVHRLSLQLSQPTVVEGLTLPVSLSRDEAAAEPLTVNVYSSNPSQLLPPAPVTIPANETTVSFAVLAVDDAIVEPNTGYSLTAVAAGYANGTASLVIQDNDWPKVRVEIAEPALAEGSGMAMGLVIRDVATERVLSVELESSDPGLLWVPARVSIAANEPRVSFPLIVGDNDLVDGARQVTVKVYVLDASGRARLTEGTPDTVEITDDDGPTLRLTLARNLVAEGQQPATVGTVTRNVSSSQPLEVTLSSSDTTEATAPPTVTIPGAQVSATFDVTTVQDGTVDGNQSVTLTASANGYNPGSTTMVVSDRDLPDLVIRELTVPADAETEARVQVSFRLANAGLAPASGTSLQQVFLSPDAVLGGDDQLLGEYPLTPTLPVGQSVQQSLPFTMPRVAGNYWIIVVADADKQIAETIEDNNTSIAAAPIRVAPAYSATVETDVETAAAGTPIPLRGSAVTTAGRPAAFVPVNVHIWLRESRRVIAAITDSQGKFTTTFQPLPGEAGHYQVAAAHPGVAQATVQDDFILLGMRTNPGQVQHMVVSLGAVSGAVRLENLSEVPLTGLQATVTPIEAVEVEVQVTNTLAGSGAATVNYTIRSLAEERALTDFQVQFTSAEGVTTSLGISLLIKPLEPHIVVNPAALAQGMVRGQQALVSLDVHNVGGAPTGPMRVVLPDVPWMQVISTNPTPSLGPDERTTVVLQLVPADDVPIGEYKGQLSIAGATFGANIPFAFKNVSAALGDLKIITVDERAYHGENLTNLAGVSIVLRDPFNGEIVAQGQSDTNGVFQVAALREGTYNFDASAPKHDRSGGTVSIKPGQLNEQVVFLRTQLVRYNWTVEEIEIEDRTQITLETVYETFVPTPVVTVEPSLIDLASIQGNQEQIDLKITNHGLVAANDLKIRFEEHPLWTLTPLISELKALPAKSSVTVPVMIQRKTNPGLQAQAAAGAGLASGSGIPCTIRASVEWVLVCGPFGIAYPVPVLVINAYGDCVPKTTPRDIEVPWWPPPPPYDPGGGGGRRWEIYDGVPWDPGIRIYDTPPTYSKPNDCTCQEGSYTSKCVKLEVGAKLDWAGKLVEILTARLPTYFKVEGIKLKVLGSGQICTCCAEKMVGLKAKTEVAGELEGKLTLGYRPTITNSFEVPDFGGVTCVAELLVGVELSVSGSARISYETECHLRKPKLCFQGRVGAKGMAGVRGTAKFSAKAPDGTKLSATGKITAGVEAGVQASVQLCDDGKGGCYQIKWDDVVAKLEAEASFKQGSGAEKYVKAGWSYVLVKGGTISEGCTGGGQNDQFPEGDWGKVGLAQELGSPPLGGPAGASLAGCFGNGEDGAPRFRQVTFASLPPRPAVDPELRRVPRAGKMSEPSGVCAQVRLQIDQQAVVTRKAIGATLEIFNEADSPLENVDVNITVYDPAGEVASDKFVALQPELTAIEVVNVPVEGGEPGATRQAWRLGAATTGRARWVILPKDEAAPTEPLVYKVGGVLSYTVEGVPTSAILVPAPVNVYPNAKLHLQYFHQREVFSDDPFTDEVEPSEPFSLAILVRNSGRGLAKNFSITSGQPKIIENFKGLLIDFKIIATEVAGQSMMPSLKADFGDLKFGEIKIARWLLQASLLGFFVDYKASFQHEDALGGRETSLIDSVDIHEMIHLVQAAGPFEDGRPDFLVNDDKDDGHVPEVIYLSDGTTNLVTAVTAATVNHAPSADNLTVQLTANLPPGWTYLRVPEPADGAFDLVQVLRADGVSIALNTNVWITRYTFTKQGVRPTKENTLHLLDFNSAGVYTLVYAPKPTPDVLAPMSTVAAMVYSNYTSFPVQWSGQDEGGAGVAYYDVFVSVNGGPFLPWQQKTKMNGAVYAGALGNRYAFYTVATDLAGNREAAPAVPDAETYAARQNQAPVLQPIPDLAADEGERIEFALAASDADVPAQKLSFSLVSGPAGLTVDPVLGVIQWQTGERDGPGTNTVTVCVRDDGQPVMETTRSFAVIVREVNTAPALPTVPEQTLVEGRELQFTIPATDADWPANRFVFSLEPGAPVGATIDPVTGLFHWLAREFQGPATNTLTVKVTDDGEPALSATTSFTVIVTDALTDFYVQLGSTNLLAGQTAVVPIQLHSGADLTNLVFALELPASRLKDLMLQGTGPELAAGEATQVSGDRFSVRLAAAPGQKLATVGPAAFLRFTAVTNQESAIMPLVISHILGQQANGLWLTRAVGFNGKVVVIGTKPVLEAVLLPARARALVLYGRPNRTYVIEQSDVIGEEAWWNPWTTFRLSATFHVIQQGFNLLEHESYYRAYEQP
jgi:hypothetical protein